MTMPTLSDVLFATSPSCAHGRPGGVACPTCSLAQPVARRTDPETSHLAAKDAQPKAGTHRALALRTLTEHPEGLTDFDLARLTGVPQTSIGVRRKELVRAGLVVATDERRKAPSGSLAIVWRAA